MSGLVALHGGGEYIAGDEPAMDALFAAATAVGADPLIVIVPTAAARQRPDLAASHGERAFRAAAGRAGATVRLAVASIVAVGDAADPVHVATLERADLVHFPGGDPDLIPGVLRGSPAWAAILAALERGACVAGASAGAMALGERLWTPRDGLDGLGLVPGVAVLPHFGPGRLAGWRTVAEAGHGSLTWLGLDEQTLVIGRPGGEWTVAGRGRAHVIAPGAAEPGAEVAAGGRLRLG